MAANRCKLVAWPLARASPDPAFASRQQAGLRGKGRSPRRFLRHRGAALPAGEGQAGRIRPHLTLTFARGRLREAALPSPGLESPRAQRAYGHWYSEDRRSKRPAGGDAPLPSSLRHLGGAAETHFRRSREPWRCWPASARPASAQRFLRYPGSRALAFSVFRVSCDSPFPFYTICPSLSQKKKKKKSGATSGFLQP